METRASYVFIGAFTLLAIFAGLGFFLWLAQIEINKTYTQYDILFDQAGGLSQSSPVRFNGVDVGKVLKIALDRNEESKVRVRIEVSANTPIRQGTEATLSSQGVTGVGFVGLEGGTTDDPRLPIDPVTEVAEIPSKPTAVQSLIEDAPDLLKQAQTVLDNVGQFTTQKNADHVAQILANLDKSSGQLTSLMDDLSKASGSLSDAADKIASFSDKLDSVATNADGVITNADGAITEARKAVATINTSLADVQGAVGDFRKAMADARSTLANIDDFAAKGLPQFTAIGENGSRLIQDLSKLVAKIERDPPRFFLGNRTPEFNN